MVNKIKFEDFKQTFFQGKTNKKDLFKQAKAFYQDFESLLKFSNRIEQELKNFISLFNNALLGQNALPQSYSNLGKNNNQYFTNSLEQEINWQGLSFLKHSSKINDFLSLKNKFENFLLLGEYEQARNVIEKIEKDICFSYWSIENRFILEEYQFGSERNWEIRNKIIASDNDAFVRVIGNMYSVKAEKRVSFFQYNENFNNWQEAQGLNNSLASLSEYFRFKANYFSLSQYNHLLDILYRESSASIIDRYLLFVKIFQHHILSSPSISPNFLFLLKKLNEVINDICIDNILIIADRFYKINKKIPNNKIIDIIDKYTQGNYKNSKDLAKTYLINNESNVLELCEIYAKSLIELNLSYEKITTNDSLLNQVSKIYFDILSKVEYTDDVLIDLVKLAYTFNNNHIGMSLYDFLKRELDWKTDINYSFLANLNSKFLNPRLLDNIYQLTEISQNFIQNISSLYQESITVKLFADFYKKQQTTDEHFFNTPSIKNKIYQLRNLMLLDKYNECIEQYSILLVQGNLSIITQYEVVSNLFLCYLNNNDYRNCVILYVNTYLQNAHLTQKMNDEKVLNSIVKEKFKNVNNTKDLIDLPIFFQLACNDKVKIKQSYELFLKANNYSKASELIVLKEHFKNNKLIFFLKNVCVTDILQLSTVFESTEKVNAERISICKFLAEFDNKNADSYKAEIINLTQKNTISKVLAGVDERKVYVNEFKIRELITKPEKQNFLSNQNSFPLTSEAFERYVKLLNYIKNNNEYKTINSIIEIDEDGKMTLTEPEKDKSYIDNEVDVVLYYPAYKIFVTFFFFIRELFVFDKEYGLDAYLSTRIRHGTLPNHLRSVFETFMLVTTQTNGVYVENQHWANKLELNNQQMEELQRYLSDFSAQIDNFSKEIKDKIIQCKTEKKNSEIEATFNFSYTETELIWLFLDEFQEILSLDMFIDKVFVELWKRTEKCLTHIQKDFNLTIKDRYIEIITKLQSNILHFERHHVSELQNNLVSVKTEIQNKLNNISKWFRRSESSFDGEYELKILAEASIQITKNIHPNYHFEINSDVCEGFNIKGEHHQHFIDLMNNCLFNIIKHSEVDCESLNAKLKIIEQDYKLFMIFENCVANTIKHHDKLLNIKNNWKNSDSNVSQEGGTGFPKIKKIIHSDLGRKQSNFSFYFEVNKLFIELSFEINELKA